MKSLYVLSTRRLKPSTLPLLMILMHKHALNPKHKKMLVVVMGALFLSLTTLAQAPYQFSFQGIARDGSGKVISNANVTVRTKIHKDGPNGTVIFTETQVVQTNASGIFNLVVGGLNGQLNSVNWGSDNCFFQTEVDVTGGSNFVDLGTTQLKSVPYALASRQWVNNVPIVQTGLENIGPALPALQSGPNLIWYPKKAAFRSGKITNASLVDDTNVGLGSFATGEDASAKGNYSISMGYETEATNEGATAMGIGNKADGYSSVALGRLSSASGYYSVSIGHNLYAKSNGSVALGAFNNNLDNEGNALLTDRIFQLGNGTPGNRSNAITVLRNGNVGIGNNVLAPEFMMDLGGRMRIKHNGETAGIHFNSSANNADGFVGMKTDDDIGFWVNNGWRFWVNSSNAQVNGSIVNTSDRRLKEKIALFSTASLPLLHTLNGYHYYWKNKQQGAEMQTGLIAQEVEQRFPELVVTGKDGYKAVNYIGLIPHLIEAVKELDKKTDEISALKKELAQLRELNQKVMQVEASLKALLSTSASSNIQTSSK